MRVTDRLTGKEELGELPGTLMPGRYCLLHPFLFNEHSALQAGDLLCDDGSGIIQQENCEHRFLPIEQSEQEEADSELAVEAIMVIAGKIDRADYATVSPMLPSEMAAQCEQEEVEQCLADILKGGHLHSISNRPQKELRYDDLLAPVGRVRRLATSALSHLASHSDCWQQRTLSGVLPRKLLARFSEDDFSIYENRLYKRLLDRLDKHLTRRLARIRGLSSRLEKALEFQGSEQTHFRLRRDICKLWGESYQDDKTGVQLDAGRIVLAELVSQLCAVRGLKQRGLYKLVPVAAAVATQIHRTNILNHDPHYRKLPLLWEKLRNDRDENQLRPDVRLARQQQIQKSYGHYIGLVLRRALERYELRDHKDGYEFSFAGDSLSVTQEGNDWIIQSQTGKKLRLVAIAWFGKIIASGEDVAPNYVLCWPGNSSSCSVSQRLHISPLDLYVVESMGQLIDRWLLDELVATYGITIGPLPTPAKRLIDACNGPFQNISNTHVRLISPLNDQQKASIYAELAFSANTQLMESMKQAIRHIDALAHCRCGHTARWSWSVSNATDFYCICESCETTWSLKSIGKKRQFIMRPKESNGKTSNDGFDWAGRDWIEFEVG